MEKIAITSEGPTLDDSLDPRFGRAAGFIVVDPNAEINSSCAATIWWNSVRFIA